MSTKASTARKPDFIETDTGNKIYRGAQIEGKPNIMLGGRCVVMRGVCLRGDLHRVSAPADKSLAVAISVGRCTVMSTGTVVQPPSRISKGQMSYHQMKIGDNVFIGPDCVISSASIGSHVHVGANCVLSPLCIIKENCKILPGTIIPEAMVVPAGMVVGGRPARICGEVGEGWGASTNGPDNEWVEGGDLRALVRSFK